MKTKRIAVLVGSLRKESFSRKTAKALMGLAPGSLTLELLEIGGLHMMVRRKAYFAEFWGG